MTIKRRLELLPEILPKPERAPQAPSPVRARTLARLSVLAALTAAACGGKEGAYGVVDPLPSPTGGSGGDGGNGGGGGLGGAAGLGGGGGFAGTAYGVVDPLPRPCSAIPIIPQAFAIFAHEFDTAAADAGSSLAEADAGDAGARPAALDAGAVGPGRGVRLQLVGNNLTSFGAPVPVGSGLEVLSQDGDLGTTILELRITADSAEFDISTSCGAEQGRVRVQIVLGATDIAVSIAPS